MKTQHKAVSVTGLKSFEDVPGVVTAIVSVTGLVDNVNDVIIPGAYTKTLSQRKPKGIWQHDWKKSISKTLDVKELMPGDPQLPATLPNGQPWPETAGGLLVKMQFNMNTQRGRDAYEDVKFYGDEQEWSIGYRVPSGKSYNEKGIRYIKELDLFEYSPVLFGAMPNARTTSVKSAQETLIEQKNLHGTDAYDFLLNVKEIADVDLTDEFVDEPTGDFEGDGYMEDDIEEEIEEFEDDDQYEDDDYEDDEEESDIKSLLSTALSEIASLKAEVKSIHEGTEVKGVTTPADMPIILVDYLIDAGVDAKALLLKADEFDGANIDSDIVSMQEKAASVLDMIEMLPEGGTDTSVLADGVKFMVDAIAEVKEALAEDDMADEIVDETEGESEEPQVVSPEEIKSLLAELEQF